LGTQETFCIVIAGLLERDSFDLFLPEFDKPWVIHLRETCCCSTNLCIWRPNTVYKNRSVCRHQATSYQQKERRHITRRKHISQDHLAVTIVLGAEAVVDDLDHHHQSSMGAQSMEELEDLDLQIEGTAIKMMKRRWGHRALPVGFALCQYPKGLSYLTINKSMTDHRSHSHGSQTIYKQCKYWEEPKKQLCKVCIYTSPAQQGHG
jgi:hypothetical protein